MSASQPSLNSLLKATSRSFYLSLRVLPGSVREPIGLAYLLARTSDTIADTEVLPVAERLSAMAAFRGRLVTSQRSPLGFSALAREQGSSSERLLLERVEESLAVFERINATDRALIASVLETITSGQELDLRRFAGASAEHIVVLNTSAELDDYTYRVAGCVGEFWTKICRAHLFPRARMDDAKLLADADRFGRGLQLVNVLRDLPRDLRQGRCYLPADELGVAGLEPRDLLEPSCLKRLRPVYDRWLNRAEDHLHAGWAYTNALPWRCARVRLACAWPLLIGFRTLDLLRTGNVLAPEERLKVSRPEVKKIIRQSLVRYPFPPWWQALANEGVQQKSRIPIRPF
jgi:farnesyl-diphosphate farnesyltransferase